MARHLKPYATSPGEVTQQPDNRPRWLDRDALAAYIKVRVDRIPRLLKAGKLPTPSYHLGPCQPRYDVRAVDAMMGGNTPPEQVYAEQSYAERTRQVVEAYERESADGHSIGSSESGLSSPG